jgi:hypothetical protein
MLQTSDSSKSLQRECNQSNPLTEVSTSVERAPRKRFINKCCPGDPLQYLKCRSRRYSLRKCSMSLAAEDIKLSHTATTGRKIFSRLQIIVSSLLQLNASCVSAKLCRSQVSDKSPDCRTFLCSHRTQKILE